LDVTRNPTLKVFQLGCARSEGHPLHGDVQKTERLFISLQSHQQVGNPTCPYQRLGFLQSLIRELRQQGGVSNWSP
jgi:hypothetical protein